MENAKAVAYYTLAFKSASLKGIINKEKPMNGLEEKLGRSWSLWSRNLDLVILLRQLRHAACSMTRARRSRPYNFV
jgi:hypothetical protein